MKITVMYERRDFFGGRVFTEETNEYGTIEQLKKAFTELKKDYNFAIHIDGCYVITWDSIEDFENEILKVRTYENWNSYSDCKKAFTAVKRDIIKKYK